jgi:hypothetical protein
MFKHFLEILSLLAMGFLIVFSSYNYSKNDLEIGQRIIRSLAHQSIIKSTMPENAKRNLHKLIEGEESR